MRWRPQSTGKFRLRKRFPYNIPPAENATFLFSEMVDFCNFKKSLSQKVLWIMI